MDGAALFAVVEEYAAIGDHRTGTPADAATIEWFTDQLRRRGGAVTVKPFEFPRYDATWRVAIDGADVEAIPLFYSGVGSVRSARPAIGRVPVVGAATTDALTEVAAARGHAVALVATTGTGRLTAINRPVGPADGIPMLTVGPEHDLDGAALDVAIDARCVAGRSANVVASFDGATPAAPGLVIATPLSGWFRCAGERGTGIAVLLGLIEPLAARGPLTVVGSSGHELEGEGLRQLLAATALDPDAVIHLGASIASRGDGDRLAPGIVRHSDVGAGNESLRRALAPLDRHVETIAGTRAGDAAAWIGEARQWCATGAPMLSMTGGSPLFHTAADLPVAATSPELLALAAEVTGIATAILADAAVTARRSA